MNWKQVKDHVVRTLLVTGASGFVGRHFIAEAVKRGYYVSGIGRGHAPQWLPMTVKWISADISKPKDLNVLKDNYWGVAHFANISKPADYVDDGVISKSLEMISILTAHLQSARFLFPSSCHVYKASDAIKFEDSDTEPAGRYGRAKLAAELFLLSERHLDVRIARPFNHIGQHMPSGLMLPSLAARVKAARAGEPIFMRGKNSVRDFLDVRDIVAAYLDLLEIDNPEYRIYNVCSGEPTSIRTLAERCIQLAGKSNNVSFDEHIQSADDTDVLVGSPARILKMTKWTARYSLDQSIASII